MSTKLTNDLRRDSSGAEDATPHQRTCIELHLTHVALENEIHRLCSTPMGEARPDYNLLAGECHHVSHDLPKIMNLHGTKAQAGVIRNMIMCLQERGLWDLPPESRITCHEWIHR